MATPEYTFPVRQLLLLGDPRELSSPMNLTEFGINKEHIPDLIRLAIETEFDEYEPTNPEVWGPVYAWRALGSLHAEEAITPLVGLLNRIEENDDDWVQSELPEVFGKIGPVAIPALKACLNNEKLGQFVRGAAATSIAKIAKRTSARTECIDVLGQQLQSQLELPVDRFEDEQSELATFIVEELLQLQAVEKADLIEAAYATGNIVIGLTGDWEDAQVTLGLMSERTTARKDFVSFSPEEYAQLSTLSSQSGSGQMGQGTHPKKKQDPQKKAKRKLTAKARKQNRKKK